MEVVFILVSLVILLLILRIRSTSSYTATTPIADRYALPVFIGKAINLSSTLTKTYFINGAGVSSDPDFIIPGTYGAGGHNTKTWDELNKLMWTTAANGGVYNRTFATGIALTAGTQVAYVTGFKKVLQAGGGGAVTWFYSKAISENNNGFAQLMTADAGVLAEVDIGGTLYDIPDQIIAARSVTSPFPATDCTFTVTSGTCNAPCGPNKTGTQTDTVNSFTAKTHDGADCTHYGTTVTALNQTINRSCTKSSKCPWVGGNWFYGATNTY
jgi:hypothetical protein